MQKEVVIVGGGVVGLVLAKELAKNGIETTVYEAKRSIGEGANKASGILSVGGLNEIGVDYRAAVQNWLDGATLYGGEQDLKIKARQIQAYILDREILARLCANEAEKEGAKIITNTPIDGEMLSDFEKDKIIVGADGVVSKVASHFGFPKIDDYVLTYKAEYKNALIDDQHRCRLFFSDAPKRFFGWTVPYSSSVLEVGVGEWMHSRRNSLSVFNSFVKNAVVDRSISSAEKISGHASIIPLQTRSKTVKGNVLLVGDAAGQVKATTGGGIVFGSLCAKIAANTIKEHIKNGTPLSLYEKDWRRKYGLDLRLHRFIHTYYSRMGGRTTSFIFKLAKLSGAEKFLGEYGDMDRPSVVVKRLLIRRRAPSSAVPVQKQ